MKPVLRVLKLHLNYPYKYDQPCSVGCEISIKLGLAYPTELFPILLPGLNVNLRHGFIGLWSNLNDTLKADLLSEQP